MTPAQIAEAAQLLLEARRTRTRLTDLPAALTPTTTAAAEAICEAMARGFEQPTGGWKIGAAGPGDAARRGLERPFCGQIPARYVYTSPARLVHAQLSRAVVEAEIGIRLGGDLPPRERAYSRAEVAACVAGVHAGIEIPESRLADEHRLGTLGMVADQGYAGRYVVGDGVRDWQRIDLTSIAVTLSINGRVIARGTALQTVGDALEALVWLANQRSRCGDGLKSGQIVSTGSLTGIQRVSPGDIVLADFTGLGVACVELS